jgi:hypothetical protein
MRSADTNFYLLWPTRPIAQSILALVGENRNRAPKIEAPFFFQPLRAQFRNGLRARPFLFFGTSANGLRSGVFTHNRSHCFGGVMFADSLLESSWESRSHRGWTTLASFAVQLLGLGMLLLLPLLYTEVLPKLRLLSPAVPFSAPPTPAPPAPAGSHHNSPTSNAINMANDRPFVSPRSVPTSITPDTGISASPPVDIHGVWTPGSTSAANSHRDWGTKQLWFRHRQLFTHRVRPFP